MFRLVIIKRRSSSVPVVTSFDLEKLQEMLETTTLTVLLKEYKNSITKVELAGMRFTCS